MEISQLDASTWQYTRYPHMDVKVDYGLSGNKKFFLHRDHLATVKQVTTDTGGVVEDYSYAAFGEMVKNDNSGTPITVVPPTKKTFIGERFDVETGLSYLHSRYLNPVSGHMVSPDDWDPTKDGVGTNRYAYSGNDPINKSDPNGHWFGLDDVVAGGVGALGGMLVQAGFDVYHGEFSGFSEYGIQAVAGAVLLTTLHMQRRQSVALL